MKQILQIYAILFTSRNTKSFALVHIYWMNIFNNDEINTFQWRYDERDGVLNHRRLDCLLNRLFRRRSKKTSKLRVTGLGAGNSPVAGEFPAQRASNAENVSIWWRHHAYNLFTQCKIYWVNICCTSHTHMRHIFMKASSWEPKQRSISWLGAIY